MRELRATLLAGGYGKRMGRLGRGRVKPSIPFGTRCHLMDFSLNNALRSGLDEVLLLSRYHEELLHSYLLKAWDARLPIHFGPFNALHHRPAAEVYAEIRRPEENGTADALICNRPYIDLAPYRDVMVLHSDHVYDFDYRAMYRFHRDSRAALTIGYQRIPREFVSLFGMVEVDRDQNLRAFVEKPPQPTSDTVFTAVCIFETSVLYRHLEALQPTAWNHDISRDVIPHMLLNKETIKCFPFEDYWEDIGTAARYHRAHMNLLAGIGVPLDRMPCTLEGGDACVPHDLPHLQGSIAPRRLAESAPRDGLQIRRSVIFAGATVGEGAIIEDSVLLPGCDVAPGVTVRGSIVCNDERITDDFIDRLE
jgi:valienol-1-phosphate guanylyltransferase